MGIFWDAQRMISITHKIVSLVQLRFQESADARVAIACVWSRCVVVVFVEYCDVSVINVIEYEAAKTHQLACAVCRR